MAESGARKPAARKKAATARKATGAKTTTKKKAAAKPPASKTSARKATASKAAGKKTATRKTAAKKTTTRKAAAKKTATRRAASSRDATGDATTRATARRPSTRATATRKAPAQKTETVRTPATRKSGARKPAARSRAAAAATEPELAPAAVALEPEMPSTAAIETPQPPFVPPTGPPGRADVDAAAQRLGIEQLHPEQRQVIGDAIDGRDVLMVLPTGFGKSACYQVPSMLLPRPTVVVSPLLALLKDQHEKLLKRGIRSIRLDGSVRGGARKAAFEDLARGGPILVMTTPETLASPEASAALERTGVSLVAIDEAHCLSEWGYDFRPAYLRLGARLRQLAPPAVLALTATATERVRDAIVGSLGLREPTIVSASPHRSNLAFEVLRCDGDMRPRALLRLVQRLRRPGIIYCATRREVDMVWALLQRFKIPCHRYHGGMNAGERATEQERFMHRGRRTVMVATSAFGLGIDKPDIRYVLHFQAPASLEQYVQEAGRGGRDGRKSNCIMLFDGADRSIHEALLARSRIRPDQLYKLGKALAAWSGEERDPTLEALALSAELGPRITTALLAKVEEAGLVAWDEDRVHIVGSKDTIEADTRGLAGQFETLRTQDARRLDVLADYANDFGCRATFLRRYFGEPDDEPCGLCDVCRGLPKRPTGFFAPLKAPDPPKRKRRGRRSGRRGGEPRPERRGERRRPSRGG
ncbi:MAG: RecQ family ATP-dependent DNA helicase, partial [Myxococcota bacterium]|nr:RecQ family ATP-dependent DNA helicase [Myxococcota bacterium]